MSKMLCKEVRKGTVFTNNHCSTTWVWVWELEMNCTKLPLQAEDACDIANRRQHLLSLP